MKGLFWSIHVQFLVVCLFFLETQIFAQQGADFTLINDRLSFGPVVLDGTSAYCYWPKSAVVESSITAIELATGRHLWTRPSNLAFPVSFRVEEGWLIYETAEGEPGSFRRPSGPKTFHLVNAASGDERSFPNAPDLRSNVDRAWVRDGRCLTPQGQLIRCSDGQVIGNLGLGEHQTIASNGSFLVMTLIPNGTNTRFERRLLRKFDLKNMNVEREMELPLETSWRIIANMGDLVVGRMELADRSSYLTCIDLAQRTERWRVPVPKSVYTSPYRWESESQLSLSAGVHGMIRPLWVNLESGAIAPDMSWRDPRLLLAWHQEGGQYPDFVAANEKFIVARWRYLQLSCVDPQTGQLVWNQSTSEHMIGRLFSSDAELGDYVVAETKSGFDIIRVASGDRTTVTPEQVGLEVLPPQNYLEEEIGTPSETPNSLFGDPSVDWIWDKGLSLGPLIPFAAWLIWTLTRREFASRNPIT